MNFVLERIGRRAFCALAAAVFAAATSTVGLAAPFSLPPIGGPGPAEHHAGKIIWADLATPDLAAAERFYSGLFGWTFQLVHAGKTNYAVALLDGRPLAGLLEKPLPKGERRQPAWLTFIAVRDADATEGLALHHGGKRLSEPKSYAGRGRQAVLEDPEGATFGILASSSGDTPDVLAEPGEWIWSSLLAHDPGRECAFYKAVIGYDVFDLASDDGAVHAVLSTDDYARASVNSLPPAGHRRPHWLNFVRVVNALESSSTAVSLGGRVLVPPHEDRHGGKVAVVADPTGAPIGLMEWAQTETTAEPK